MGKQGEIAQYRERLDQTLASHHFSDEETLTVIAKDKILRSQEISEKQGNTFLSSRVAQLSNLIDLLRSASDNYVAPPNKAAHSSWKVKTDNKDIRVMYREGPLGSPIHTLLAEGYIDAPIDVCLCVVWETAIYRTWFPELKVPTFKIITAKCLQKVRTGEQVSLVRVKVPWPLTAREVVLRYIEFEYFEDDLIIVVLNSLPDEESIGLMDDDSSGAGQAVKIGYVGGFALQNVTEGRSYFRTIANLDLKIDFVPPWLINFVSRQVIGSAFKLYKKSVATVSDDNANFGKVLNDPMYEHIREGIYSKGRRDSILGNRLVRGDARAYSEGHNEFEAYEFPNKSNPLLGGDAIHESSSKNATSSNNFSAMEEDEVQQAKNSDVNNKLAAEPHRLDTVDGSHFREKMLSIMWLLDARKFAVFLPVVLILVWISFSLVAP